MWWGGGEATGASRPGEVVGEQWVTKGQAQLREKRDQRPVQGSWEGRIGLVGEEWGKEAGSADSGLGTRT